MKRASFLLAGIVVIGAGLRFYALGAKSLWLDEALSWRLLDFPTLEMIRRTGEGSTANPPLYFLVLGPWTAVWGDSEFALRSLGAMFGLVTILGTYCFTRVLVHFPQDRVRPRSCQLSPGVPLLAAGLVALSPLQIYVARQARGYSLGAALFVWSSWSLLRALGSNGRRGMFWVLYGLLALAFCYTHYLGAFMVAAQGLFTLTYFWFQSSKGRSERKTDKPPVRQASGEVDATTAASSREISSTREGLAHKPDAPAKVGLAHKPDAPAKVGPSLARQACVPLGTAGNINAQMGWALVIAMALAIGYFPWLSRLRDQSDRVIRYSWQGPLQLESVADETLIALTATAANRWPVDAALAWSVTAWLAGALVFLAWCEGWAGWYVFLTGLVPVALILGYSIYSGRSLFMARYLAFVQLAWLAGLAMLLSRIRSRFRWFPAGALVLGWGAYSCAANWDVIGPSSFPGMRGALACIRQHRTDDEPLVVQNSFLFFPSLYYARGQGRPFICAEETNREVHPQAAQLKNRDFITPEDLMAGHPSGLWCLSSSSYGQESGIWFPLPDSWRLESAEMFAQDNPWEEPILVEHYTQRGRD